MMNDGKILGLDYGTKRIGIATADMGGGMAFPKVVLANDAKLISNLSNFIKKEGVKKVVIGESKNYKMQDNEIMQDILDLKAIIEHEMEVDVVLHSELMSSVEAEKTQYALGGNNDMLDASAAAIILQSYLDGKKHAHTRSDECDCGHDH